MAVVKTLKHTELSCFLCNFDQSFIYYYPDKAVRLQLLNNRFRIFIFLFIKIKTNKIKAECKFNTVIDLLSQMKLAQLQNSTF